MISFRSRATASTIASKSAIRSVTTFIDGNLVPSESMPRRSRDATPAERRTALHFDGSTLALNARHHCQRVVAIDHLGSEVTGAERSADLRDVIEAHSLRGRLAAHRIEVVHKEEQHG